MDRGVNCTSPTLAGAIVISSRWLVAKMTSVSWWGEIVPLFLILERQINSTFISHCLEANSAFISHCLEANSTFMSYCLGVDSVPSFLMGWGVNSTPISLSGAK